MSKDLERLDIGGKAYGLQQLEALSVGLEFKVPEYDIVSPALFLEFQVDEEQANTVGKLQELMSGEPAQATLPVGIEKLVQEYAQKYNGKKVQVRSNSKREGGKHSFRGRYDSITVESVNEQSLRNACWEVYNSLYSEKAVEYRKQNDIADDEMGVIIQEFAEGEYYGVVHTAKPDYPAATTISFSKTHGAITDSLESPVVLSEYIKTDSEPEHLFTTDDGYLNDVKWSRRLAVIAQRIEEELGYSELEFAISDDEIYLLQRDTLRNVQEPEAIDIPDYDSDSLVGETYMTHGIGKATFPVVKLESPDDVLLRLMQGEAGMQKMEMLAGSLIEDWFNNMRRLDAQYPDGYILVTTHFNETMFSHYSGFSLIENVDIPRGANFDTMTPNKKVVITTAKATPTCHAITVAREKGIMYAGFQDREDIYDSVSTGQLLSVYFKDGKAILYKENAPTKSITEFGITVEGECELKLSVDSSSEVNSLGESVANELSSLTSMSWRFEPSSGMVGGTLVCENEEYSTPLRGYRMANQYTILRLDPSYVHEDIRQPVETLLAKFA